jgi:hypothetical protein
MSLFSFQRPRHDSNVQPADSKTAAYTKSHSRGTKKCVLFLLKGTPTPSTNPHLCSRSDPLSAKSRPPHTDRTQPLWMHQTRCQPYPFTILTTQEKAPSSQGGFWFTRFDCCAAILLYRARIRGGRRRCSRKTCTKHPAWKNAPSLFCCSQAEKACCSIPLSSL